MDNKIIFFYNLIIKKKSQYRFLYKFYVIIYINFNFKIYLH